MRRLNIADPQFTYDPDDPDGLPRRDAALRAAARRRADRARASTNCRRARRSAPTTTSTARRSGSSCCRGVRPCARRRAPRRSSRSTSSSSRAARRAPTRSATTRDAAARVLMWSSILYPSVSVYPDSDKIGVWTVGQGRQRDRRALERRRLLPRRDDVAAGYRRVASRSMLPRPSPSPSDARSVSRPRSRSRRCSRSRRRAAASSCAPSAGRPTPTTTATSTSTATAASGSRSRRATSRIVYEADVVLDDAARPDRAGHAGDADHGAARRVPRVRHAEPLLPARRARPRGVAALRRPRAGLGARPGDRRLRPRPPRVGRRRVEPVDDGGRRLPRRPGRLPRLRAPGDHALPRAQHPGALRLRLHPGDRRPAARRADGLRRLVRGLPRRRAGTRSTRATTAAASAASSSAAAATPSTSR